MTDLWRSRMDLMARMITAARPFSWNFGSLPTEYTPRSMLERFWCDAVDVCRELRTRPLILIAAVFTLAASIGMNVAMFGLVDRALLSPPRHIHQPDRLFSLAFHAPGEPDGQAGMTTTSYVA